MRKIAATYVFSGQRPPVKNGILVCENDGTIVELIDNQGNFKEEAGVEFYSGLLVPGFVNTHCHLELSHLKNKISEKTGIGDFIGNINKLRIQDEEKIHKAIDVADKKMWAQGIAAVGDISNSNASITVKSKSKLYYHTFVECFGFHPNRAERSFNYAKTVSEEFKKNKLKTSIVPHSPYSVSEPLFKKIRENAELEMSLFSIHNQESEGESQFFLNGYGPIKYHLMNNLGIDISHWRPTGKSSLTSILKYLPTKNRLLLIHNTFTQQADLENLKEYRSIDDVYFTLCPNSNLYIENKLPPLNLFEKNNANICLGTDSLASNHNLSILSEIITLHQHFPETDWRKLLTWATINGAHALGVQSTFGTFEPGKKPGINLISGFDFRTMKFSNSCRVKRLI